MPFNQQGIAMVMQGLGRMEEILKKCRNAEASMSWGKDPLQDAIIH
jgi:hypothetical protein